MASKDRETVRQGLGDILDDDLMSQVIKGDRERTGRGAGDPDAGHPPAEEPAAVAGETTDQRTGNTTGSEVGSATPKKAAESLPSASQRPTRKTGAKTAPATSGNPLEDALRAMLAQPYPEDLRKGPFIVTSMKLQADVAERLGYAASLTKRPKQDIVSEALRLYFERLLER